MKHIFKHLYIYLDINQILYLVQLFSALIHHVHVIKKKVYGAHAVDEVDTIVSKIDSDITLLYPNVTEACQIHENDVFCQSWSLYLQIHGVVRFLKTGNLNYAPDIPLSQFHKYEILLNFYKSIVPIICVELNKVYKKYQVCLKNI